VKHCKLKLSVGASADIHTVTREVTHDSLHGVVSTWDWYSLGGCVSTAGGNTNCAYLGIHNFCCCWGLGKAPAGCL